MNDIFINTYKKRPLIVSKSVGSYLVTTDNQRYLDFLSGISINNIGYGQKKISDAIKKQLNKIVHPSNYYYTEAQITLAQKLITLSGLDKVFFANSGTEANEAALLFLQKYHENRSTTKNEIITFEGTFLGRTYGCRCVAAGQSLEKIKVKRVKFNDLNAFKAAVSSHTLAVHLELVFGHGGIRPFEISLIQEIYRECQEKNILVYVDEVQAGLGRTGNVFTYQIYGIQPDIVTIGKSLGGGLPLSSVLVTQQLAECVQPGDYGSTMGGNSLACAAGAVILDYISNPKNLQKINDKGELIVNRLKLIKDRYPSKIKEVRGLGMMIGVEVDPSIAESLLQYCFKKHLLLDTVNKNVLRLLPPFTVSNKEIDKALAIIEDSIKESI